jgi:hypothetical protein
MKERLLEILQHALGVDRYGRGEQYRNYFVAGGDIATSCRELVALGFMIEHPASELTGGDPCFCVTDAGKKAMTAESPQPPKLTRSQQRYQRFLDADCGKPFKEWLKSPYGAR